MKLQSVLREVWRNIATGTARTRGFAISAASGTLVAIAGCAFGLISVRIRKLSLASALHAGVSKRALFGIITLETLSWSAVSVALGLSIVMLITVTVAGRDTTTFLPGVLATLPLLPGAFAGAWIGVMTIKEDHLFSYFKSR